MKKELLIAVLVAVTIFAFNADAAVRAENKTQLGAGEQNMERVINSGEDTQIQLQNRERVMDPENLLNSNTQEDTRTEKAVPFGSQMNRGFDNAVQRRSEVANAVQMMLQVADRSGGIGEQVRNIAREQNENQEKIEANLEKAEKRSGLVKFFIGPNYGEINEAERTLQKNRERVNELMMLRDQIMDETDKSLLEEQVRTLEANNSSLENSIKEKQKGFSLLGWMFKFFAK